MIRDFRNYQKSIVLKVINDITGKRKNGPLKMERKNDFCHGVYYVILDILRMAQKVKRNTILYKIIRKIILSFKFLL